MVGLCNVNLSKLGFECGLQQVDQLHWQKSLIDQQNIQISVIIEGGCSLINQAWSMRDVIDEICSIY